MRENICGGVCFNKIAKVESRPATVTKKLPSKGFLVNASELSALLHKGLL